MTDLNLYSNLMPPAALAAPAAAPGAAFAGSGGAAVGGAAAGASFAGSGGVAPVADGASAANLLGQRDVSAPSATSPAGAVPGAGGTSERRPGGRDASALSVAAPAGGAVAASGRRPGGRDAPASPAASAGAAPGAGERSSGAHVLGRRDASALSVAAPAGGAVAASGRRPGGREAPASSDFSPAGGAPGGAGGVCSGDLLGLLDALVVGLRSLGGERLEERLGLVGRCESRLAAVRAETVAALAARGGEAHAAGVLRGDLKQARGSAKREVQFAERLKDLPGTAEALAAGAITPQHARAIADASAHTPVDEEALLGAAAREPADVFGRTVRDHVNERCAGEDLEERRRRQRARREATIKRESDGMYKLFGLFDPVAGARVEAALAATANKLRRGEDPKRRATPAQRHADALEALITRSGTGEAPRAALVVVADYDTLAGRLRDARLSDGTPLAPSELLRLVLDADILPALFDTKGQPLWLGHKYRHASAAQRVALAIRDKGCVVCGAANSFCQAHHVLWWENGGPTDIDNLCLLCSDCHHKQIHELGATLVRGPDGKAHLEYPPNPPPPNPRRRRNNHKNEHKNEHRPPQRPATTTSARGTVNQPLQR